MSRQRPSFVLPSAATYCCLRWSVFRAPLASWYCCVFCFWDDSIVFISCESAHDGQNTLAQQQAIRDRRSTTRGRQLTLCSAAMTSTTLPPSPQRPLSQRHEPVPCGSGMRYSSTGRSLTRTCCCRRSLSSLTSERSVSSSLETVWVNAASVLGSASESEISDERVPACDVS